MKKMKEKLVDLEDITRRNNLRFDEFPENGKESLNENEEKVEDFMRNKLGVENKVTTEWTQKNWETKRKDGIINKKRTIVVRFLNYKNKESFLAKRFLTRTFSRNYKHSKTAFTESKHFAWTG